MTCFAVRAAICLLPFTAMAVALGGCSASVGTATAAPTPMAPPPEHAESSAHPVEAAEAAKQTGVPLLPRLLRPAIAMQSTGSDGAKRFEIDQATKDTPAQVADFYTRKLGLQVQRNGSDWSIQGETSNGSFLLMQIASSEGKTAVQAKILRYPSGSKNAK